MRERCSTGDDHTSSESFGCSMRELQALMQLRGAEAVEVLNKRFGGATGLCKRLKTSPTEGLLSNDLAKRREVFGTNVIPPTPPKSFFQLMWEALQDVTLIVLMAAAGVSLLLALYSKYFGGEHNPSDETEGEVSWIERCSYTLCGCSCSFSYCNK
uniref:SJCHGC07111 protein n=1 Tax=Schistosoma japonicum TaxID=6182 RepID=Q5DGU5_SCHJA|nr:SJCHGC07111 protein [Schistosoma japonicum]